MKCLNEKNTTALHKLYTGIYNIMYTILKNLYFTNENVLYEDFKSKFKIRMFIIIIHYSFNQLKYLNNEFEILSI